MIPCACERLRQASHCSINTASHWSRAKPRRTASDSHLHYCGWPCTRWVYKIVTDPRGFLWFCTYDGLSRFDDYEFVNYGVVQGLPHRSIHDLLITRNGDYWVATSAGVAHFNAFASTSDPNFKAYLPGQRPGSEIITDLYEDSSGTIWVGTGNGLFALREAGGDWQLEYVSLGEKTGERLDITSMVEDSPGVLWVGAEQGLPKKHKKAQTKR
jgi:ligand-binding sensor domain-containing protein